MNRNTDLKTIAEKLFAAKKVVLFPHVNPDGDSVGSCSALSLALRQAGVECYVCVGDYPQYMKHINSETFTLDPDKVYGADIAVAVDCSADNRLDSRLEAFKSGKEKMCVDHHMNPEGYGEVYYIDEDAAAVSEIVFEIIKLAGARITRDMANGLYTGIVTDTGGFRYSNTTPESHEKAVELMNIGVDHLQIMVNLYQNKSLKKVRAENRAVDNMLLFAGGKGNISHLTSGEMAEMDAHPQDCDEIIDRLRDIDGVEMAAYLEEREDGIKVSMRAKTTGSVVEICQKYGGGGHKKAAGCTIKDSMESVYALIKREMEIALG